MKYLCPFGYYNMGGTEYAWYSCVGVCSSQWFPEDYDVLAVSTIRVVSADHLPVSRQVLQSVTHDRDKAKNIDA